MREASGARVGAVVVAGGRGARFGGTVPKQLLEIDGRSLLELSVDAFVRHPRVVEVVVVLPDDLVPHAARWLPEAAGVVVRGGGPRRQDSVANGVEALSADVGIVLVHDAARPLVPADVISRTIEAAADVGAALAAVPARDTVKRVYRVAGGLRVEATLPRESIYLAQTPQGFRRAVLEAAVALGRAGIEATDEAALAERAGHPVAIVEGDVRLMKVTTPEDLVKATALARHLEAAGGKPGAGIGSMRIGIGYDNHRLVEGRPLVLGGVLVPFERGLAGHSDADAVCHAVTDAVLGAAGLGDIGRLFPDTDPRWRDADSIGLLRDAMDRVHAAGFAVGNVDVVIVAERPKVGPYTEAMRARLADALGVTTAAVSLKGKTNEGVDAVGRGEAIAVHAVAMLVDRAGAAP